MPLTRRGFLKSALAVSVAPVALAIPAVAAGPAADHAPWVGLSDNPPALWFDRALTRDEAAYFGNWIMTRYGAADFNEAAGVWPAREFDLDAALPAPPKE